jgi:uncharacterized protein YdaU (DUF1376 family)
LNERPFYKRYPSDFIAGTIGMTLEEKGAYSLVLDLIYDRQGPIPDDAKHIAGILGCSVRKWGALRDELIKRGKLIELEGTLDNKRAASEIADARQRSEKFAENGRKGGYNSAENRRTSSKYKTLAEAGLQHIRSEKIEKEGFNGILNPTEGPVPVKLDRYAQDKLFLECERLMGVEAPKWKQYHSFPSDIVQLAKEAMK